MSSEAKAVKKLIEQQNKKAFLEQELPLIFKKMELLNLSMDEIEKQYQKFISSKDGNSFNQ